MIDATRNRCSGFINGMVERLFRDKDVCPSVVLLLGIYGSCSITAVKSIHAQAPSGAAAAIRETWLNSHRNLLGLMWVGAAKLPPQMII